MISDEFELWYRTFLDALEVMSEKAEVQCHLLGYYNVAWEIMDDVFKGADLLIISNNFCKKLPQSKQDAITQFLNKIQDKVPDELLVFTNTETDNIISMNHPCWIPIRKLATELLLILTSPIDEKLFS